jgi:hypothetical protein
MCFTPETQTSHATQEEASELFVDWRLPSSATLPGATVEVTALALGSFKFKVRVETLSRPPALLSHPRYM